MTMQVSDKWDAIATTMMEMRRVFLPLRKTTML